MWQVASRSCFHRLCHAAGRKLRQLYTAHLRLPALRSSAFLWDFCLTRPRIVCPALEMTVPLQLLARLVLGFSLLPAMVCTGLGPASKCRGALSGRQGSVCCQLVQGCMSWPSAFCMQQLSLACVLSARAGVTAYQLPPALSLPCALPVLVHSRCCLPQQQLPQQLLLGRLHPVQTAAAETTSEQPRG